jgi:hypothetical protein
VSILHPGRTLIEKLLRVNNFAAVPEAHEGAHGRPRIGRQRSDIWALLGAEEVFGLLANPTASAANLASCFEVSQTFTPDQPVPEGGFATPRPSIPRGRSHRVFVSSIERLCVTCTTALTRLRRSTTSSSAFVSARNCSISDQPAEVRAAAHAAGGSVNPVGTVSALSARQRRLHTIVSLARSPG